MQVLFSPDLTPYDFFTEQKSQKELEITLTSAYEKYFKQYKDILHVHMTIVNYCEQYE